MKRRTAILCSGAIGFFAAGAALHYFPRWNQSNRVNVIGPLVGEVDAITTDGQIVRPEIALTADIRRFAVFGAEYPYMQRAVSTVKLTHPDSIKGSLDIERLNAAIAAFVQSETPDHPELAKVQAPTFVQGTAPDEAAAVVRQFFWKGILFDTLRLGVIAIMASALGLAMITLAGRVRFRRGTARPSPSH